ncbi:helix-turn-helix transcriptional regulator [Actinoallomurus sp. NPDC052308]|uniref:helix-turn-helix domain-containing protein n=1 Tax=Actinoallomurus sp. NPDC052308 TaxID=3155530 RepID=UPI00342E4DB8
MEARSLAEALKLIMKGRGWSQLRLARELGVSQVWVSQVSREQRDTGIMKASRLLARVGWELRITPIGEEEDPVKRRSFIAAAASVTFLPSTKIGPYQDPQYLRALATQLRTTRYEIGGVPLVATALRHLGKIGQSINAADPDLQVASAGLARAASVILYDARMFDKSESAGNLALVLAKRANHLEDTAHAFELLSQVSSYRDDYQRAAMYAQRGLGLPELTDECKARLSVRLGVSLAKTNMGGRERRSRTLLDVAHGYDGSSPATTAMILGSSGIVLSRLGHHEEGERYLDEAVHRFQGIPLLHGLWLGESAHAALRAADPNRAAHHMQAVARLGPLITSSRFDQEVDEILAESARWASVPEMRDAREQLRAIQPSTRA